MTRKAPGRSRREGLAQKKFHKMLPDDETAEKWFVERRWPNGIHCPHCGSTSVQTGAKHKTMPYRCREKECAKRFSAKTGTVMEGSKLGFQDWMIATYQLSTNLKSVSSMKLSRDLEINQRSAWFMAHRLRAALAADGDLFTGPVEADDTYMGGKRKNMSLSKRRGLKEAGVGRGPSDKEAVVGVKDRKTGMVAARYVQKTDIPHVAGFLAEKTKLGAKVHSDEAKVYTALDAFYDHESVNHSVGEYVREMARTQGMESFWSMIKRSCTGTFHKLSPKHLERYIQEFASRQNLRNKDTIDIIGAVLDGGADASIQRKKECEHELEEPANKTCPLPS